MQTTQTTTLISRESEHWYHQSGAPCFNVPRADGKGTRSPNITDARKLGLLPSVTKIEGILNKPGLQRWKLEQMLHAALTLPQQDGETLDEFASRVIEDSEAQSQAARDRGTELHTAIEKYIRGETYDLEWRPHVLLVHEALEQVEINILDSEAEKTFASPLAFGGKCDSLNFKQRWILDVKTKQVIDDSKKLAYDEHVRQLAAYSCGMFDTLKMNGIRALNVFVGVNVPQVRIREWTTEDLKRGLEQFLLLLQLWKLVNNFDPCPTKTP